MTNNGDFAERLRRVERVVAGEEDISQKQATILILDLVAANFSMHSAMKKTVDKNIELSQTNRSRLDTLEARVGWGIGLTVLVSVVAAILILTGFA